MTSSASNRLWVSECRSWLRDFRLRWRISDGLIGGKPIRSWFLFLEALRRLLRFRRFLLFSLRILRQSEVSCFSEFILRVYFCDARHWWSLAPLSNFSYLVGRVLRKHILEFWWKMAASRILSDSIRCEHNVRRQFLSQMKVRLLCIRKTLFC